MSQKKTHVKKWKSLNAFTHLNKYKYIYQPVDFLFPSGENKSWKSQHMVNKQPTEYDITRIVCAAT